MGRLFSEHFKRRVSCLDGAWKNAVDNKNVGLAENWCCGLPKGKTVMVPSVWNTENDMLSYEGKVWYEKQFFTAEKCIRLVFEGVMTEATVWLDGKLLGTHYGGFSSFNFIVGEVASGVHKLVLCVDNSFNSKSIPQAWVDWYHYGGIVRSVYVEELKGISILNNRLDYELNSELTAAKGAFTLELYNADNKSLKTTLTAKLDGIAVFEQNISLEAGQRLNFKTDEFEIQNIRLWDIGSPELYNIEFLTDTDDLLDRTGFRKVEVKNEGIYLNGKTVELRGVNRHEEYPDFGFAFPKNLMGKDLDIIEKLNCNSIRGSHYPNSKEFVDMMDERGILFWSEIPIWGFGFSEEVLADPIVVERGLNMHREMIEQYFNHPCIIIWGMHNEILSDTKPGYNMTKTFYEFLKENGGNRIITYATCRVSTDICLELCDVISINQYSGWYSNVSWQDYLNDVRKRREELGLSDKPVIMGEFGCAALYGNHTFDNISWTEEYQAELLQNSINIFHQDPMVVGFYVWQYCDMRTCRRAGLDRARGFNNKGIVNEYRKPKAAYFAVQKAYKALEREEKEC
ncbi:MAG: beta-glucuronidase [Clostridia bacterium]|nr:beta-glucuronidase [Clostridia bacterium]